MGLIYNKYDLMKLCKNVLVLIQKYQNSNIIIHKAVTTQNKLLRNTQLTIITFTSVLWLIHICKPIFVNGYIVLYETALLHSSALCVLILILQYYFSCIQMLSVFVINFVYLLICASLILVMEQLRKNLKRTINSNYVWIKEDMKKSICDHQDLLS